MHNSADSRNAQGWNASHELNTTQMSRQVHVQHADMSETERYRAYPEIGDWTAPHGYLVVGQWDPEPGVDPPKINKQLLLDLWRGGCPAHEPARKSIRLLLLHKTGLSRLLTRLLKFLYSSKKGEPYELSQFILSAFRLQVQSTWRSKRDPENANIVTASQHRHVAMELEGPAGTAPLAEQNTSVQERIPKKVHEKLQTGRQPVTYGWGIVPQETFRFSIYGWLYAGILMLLAVIILCLLIMSIALLIKRGKDWLGTVGYVALLMAFTTFLLSKSGSFRKPLARKLE